MVFLDVLHYLELDNMMIKNKIIFSAVLCVCIAMGCDLTKNVLRRDLAIRQKESLARLKYSTSITTSAIRRDALVAALYDATNESLNEPYIVSAMFAGSLTDKIGFIIVDWISASPDANGVKLLYGNGSVFFCEVGESMIKHNEREAESLLFYNASIGPISHRDIWADLQIETIVSVQLMKDGEPVSNVREFEIYSGGVNVTEKARGSERSLKTTNSMTFTDELRRE